MIRAMTSSLAALAAAAAAIFAGVFAFAVYFGLQATGTLPAVKKALGMGKKKRVKKTETGTRGATDDDWLKGTSWTTHKGGKSE